MSNGLYMHDCMHMLYTIMRASMKERRTCTTDTHPYWVSKQKVKVIKVQVVPCVYLSALKFKYQCTLPHY